MAALTCACALHPVTEEPRPDVALPADWTLEPPAAADVPDAWWRSFEDPGLDTAVTQALDANLTVGQALQRIEQAAALTTQARALYKPSLDAVAEAEQQAQREFGPGEVVAAGLSVAWEVDVFGRLRALARAQEQERLAAVADADAVRLLISSQVAEAWYLAMEQQLQLALLDEQRELASTLVELTELRFLQGDASAVDVLQQRSQLAQVESEYPVARARLGTAENRLDVLLGVAPDGASRTGDAPARLPAPESVPPLGVPADLLVQRPDLRALERQVVAADERIGAAIADRLPRLTLTGSLLYISETGATGLPTAAMATVLQPLFDWNRRAAAVDQERASHRETWLAFSEAFLVAVEEVETTLWREAQQRELLETLSRRVVLLEQTVVGTRSRYVQGITDYLPVLTAVQELQAAQRALLAERRVLVSLRVLLFRALGGPLPPGPATATP